MTLTFKRNVLYHLSLVSHHTHFVKSLTVEKHNMFVHKVAVDDITSGKNNLSNLGGGLGATIYLTLNKPDAWTFIATK